MVIAIENINTDHYLHLSKEQDSVEVMPSVASAAATEAMAGGDSSERRSPLQRFFNVIYMCINRYYSR